MSLPKLPEPDFVNNDFPELRPIRYYTKSQMIAFQAATVEACAIEVDEYMRAFYGTTYGEAKAIRAMLKEKTE